MSVSSSKEVILKKIREALTESTPLPFPKVKEQVLCITPLKKN